MAHLLSRFFKYLVTTTYIPLIFLNPVFILHLVNTTASHIFPPVPAVISHTRYPLMEALGPLPGSKPYMDMHADDALCWRYTAVMVVIQYVAFERIGANRTWAKERLQERKRLLMEKLARISSDENGAAKGQKGAWKRTQDWAGRSFTRAFGAEKERHVENGQPAKSWYD